MFIFVLNNLLNFFIRLGNVWISDIVWLMKNDLDFKRASEQNVFYRVRYLDYTTNVKSLERYKSPRIIKTHIPLKFLPDDLDKKAKVIVY